ncbi:MAG: Ig-like domain-containing protein, partial [Oscillospiraceae bacterium]|nr:Ig-like domain-containing protein [Oscillospiraceae bacterium]
VLLFVSNGTGNYNNLRPASLTLGKKGEAPASVELICDTEMRVGGNSIKAKATVKTATGSQFLGAYSIKYTSSDESVATVDDDGNIIAKGAGNARITVFTAEEGADDASILNAVAADYVDITVHEDFEGGTYSFVLTTDAILASSGLITADGKVLNGNFTKITPDKLNWMTNGYAIDGMNGHHSGNSCCMTESSLVYMIRTDGGTNRVYDNNPYIAIRLKDISAGLYRLSLFNSSASTGTAPMKVYFGKAPESYPGVGGIIDLCDNYGLLGIHDSRTAHDGTEELPAEHFEVYAEEDGDYYMVLLADPETYAMNPTATVDRPYQYVYLDNIKLETVKPLEAAELSVESDNISAPKKTQARISLFAEDGSEFIGEYDVKYSSDNTSAAVIDETSGLVTAKEVDGDTRVKITAEITPKAEPENIKTAYAYLTVTSVPEIEEIISITAGGSEHIRLTTKEVQDRIPIYVTASDNSGGEITQSELELKVTALNPEIADIDETFNIIPKAPGKASFEVSAVYRGKETPVKTATLTVAYAKEKSTYMTAEEAEFARANINKYDWAERSAKSAIEEADKIVENLEILYEMIPSEGIPRNCVPGNRSDPYVYMCKYCGCDIRADYGMYGLITNPIQHPWKIQCPDCSRRFPSNDFGSFYKLGLNEYGEFDRIRALEKHHEMIYHKNGVCSYAGECGKLPAEENRTEWLEYFGYGQGYLKNTAYQELYTSGNSLNGIDPFYYNADLDGDGASDKSIRTLGGGYGEVSAGMLWGVDDAFGYVPLEENGEERYPVNINGNRYTDQYGLQVYERHMYIATYVHNGVWYGLSSGQSGVIKYGVSNCAAAYFYTGDKKYGRVAAILLDRVADFYPDLNYEQHTQLFGHPYQGKIVDRIWSCSTAVFYIQAYDEIFELYETDPYIIEFINSRKVNGKPLKFRYAKENGNQIRTHIEDGIIRESLEGLKSGKVAGNYGMDQKVNAIGAVVLDSQPETSEWLDFMMAAGWHTLPGMGSTGGSIYEQLIEEVDADGQGTEGSAYNAGWVSNMMQVQEVLEDYPSGINLFEIPKYTQMLYSNIPLMSATYTPQIGDSSSTLGKDHWMTSAIAQDGWEGLSDPVFAQLLYLFNGNKSDGLHYDITDENPERLEDEVQAVIDEYGEFKLSSEVMTGFGFAALRSGDDFTSSVNASGKDTRRDVWMYFGALGASHAHTCALNLGMTAFGLNFMPDLGYPAATGNDVNRTQWIDTTFSHNTVIVDDKQQKGDIEIRGKIKHFSDDGNIKLMDVSAPFAYPAETYSVDEYRRSVMQIDVDDENSYVVDFFRVLGGNSHTYNLHASSNAISEHLGLGEVVPQTDENGNYIGSYAGPDVPYGEGAAGIPYGHTWLENVDRASNPEDKMEIDFEIKDFNKAIKDSKGLHLRMTMLNGTNVAKGAKPSLAITDGHPPQKAENKNIDRLKYVLLKNEGENLDSTFTTVFEPYRNERYLSSSDELVMTPVGGTPAKSDDARAVKVTHTNGRVDYIFWATNSGVTYEVTDGDITLAFRGFMGVYTMQNGENTLRYLHDGDILCEKTEGGIVTTGKLASIEGSVKSFTKTPEKENEIVITPAPGASVTGEELGALVGKLLVVENGDDVRSGTFKIEGASLSGDDIAINIGRVTPIRQYVDAYEPKKGYVYMIAEGQNARIPLSVSEDNAPVFDSVPDNLSVSAGSSITVDVNARSSPEGKTLTYVGTTLPRGASIDANTGVVTWKPTASQVGQNHFAITAVDDFGRNRTVHFTVTVYGSTTSKPSQDNAGTDSSDTTDTPTGGGGGGGGAAPAPDTDENVKPDDGETTNPDNGEDTTVGEGVPALPSKGFTDLTSHA